MKKSTIIILLAVFLISVFVVGMFGMQSVPYNEIVYIEQITLGEVSYSSGIDSALAEVKLVNGEYFVMIPYSEGLQVLLNYTLTPADVSNQNVEFSLTDSHKVPIAELDGTIVKFNKYGSGRVKVTLRATGSVKDVSVSLNIYLMPEQQ